MDEFALISFSNRYTTRICSSLFAIANMVLELGREYPTPEEVPLVQQIAAQITSDLVKRAQDLNISDVLSPVEL
jgi:hypothetical protein